MRFSHTSHQLVTLKEDGSTYIVAEYVFYTVFESEE